MKMEMRLFNGTLVCLIFFIIATGCGKKQVVPESQSSEPSVQKSESPLAHWVRFSPEGGNFSVLFPSTPQEKDQSAQTKYGKMETHSFVAKEDAQDAYGVSYNDIPKFPDIKPYLDKIQALEVGDQGKIVFQQEIKIGNNSAREIEFVKGGKANYSVRLRMIPVGQRLYLLTVIFLTENPHPEKRDAFFESFSLQ
jgi:hypothetical protein